MPAIPQKALRLYAIALSASNLHSAVLVSEDFESLTLGELNGQTGSPGISGPWQSETAITEITAAPLNFNVTLPTGETLSGGNQSLQLTGNNNNAISATLAAPQSGDFYVSFLMQMESGTIESNDFATVWFGEGTHIGSPAIGIKAELGLNSTDFMGRITGTTEAYAPEQLAIGETYYLVAKVSKTGSSTTYNQVDFWVNPGSNDELNPEGTSTGSIAFNEFQSFGIRTANLDTDDVIYYDQVTFATNWNDLFPNVPEPSTINFLLLGLLTLLHRKKTSSPNS